MTEETYDNWYADIINLKFECPPVKLGEGILE